MPFSEEIKQAAEDLGKQLGAHPGVQDYVSLKENSEIQGDALTAVQEYQLEFVKALFAQTAQRITSVLGIEYPEFANPTEEK